MVKSKNTMARNFENAPDMAINRIVEGTEMEGDIKSEGNIRIDGKFKGNIQTKGRLVVGPSGKVEGTVICQNSEVEGFVKGRLEVLQLLSLKATSRVEGDIITDKISIEPGAVFTGSCSMGSKVKEINKPEHQTGKAAEEKTA